MINENVKNASIELYFYKAYYRFQYKMSYEDRHLRETAKFTVGSFKNITGKPPINTTSKIIIPAGNHHLYNERHIQWRRISQHFTEKLHYMNDLLYYQCSPLDYQCKIQAIVQYPINGIIHGEKFQYGPIELSNSEMTCQQCIGSSISATAMFEDRNSKAIEIYFDSTMIIKGQLAYSLSIQEVSSIYTIMIKQNIISIGAMNQQFFFKKVFNDKSWNQFGLQAMRIRLPNKEAFTNFLYTVNRIKSNRTQSLQYVGSSQSFNIRGTFQKVSNLSTDILNISGYQEGRRSFATPITKNQKHNLKNSQLLKSSELIKNINTSNILSSDNKYAHSVEDEKEINFIDEFDNLFRGDTQEEELCLNKSFEEFEQMSKDSKEEIKIMEINKKKQQKKKIQQERAKILQRIELMNQQSNRLDTANKKLHIELQILTQIQKNEGPNCSQLKAIVNSMKRYQTKLIHQIKSIQQSEQKKTQNQNCQITNQQHSIQTQLSPNLIIKLGSNKPFDMTTSFGVSFNP